jgi:hypothetical protein
MRKHHLYQAHGTVMKEYAAVPARLLARTAELAPYLAKSYDYAKSLRLQPPTVVPVWAGVVPRGLILKYPCPQRAQPRSSGEQAQPRLARRTNAPVLGTHGQRQGGRSCAGSDG